MLHAPGSRSGRYDAPVDRTSRRVRGSLSAPEIVSTALALASEQGERGFSMRRLAAALGVQPATIYWHVGDRDALLDAMAAQVAHEHRGPPGRARTPQARVAAVAAALRADLRERHRLLEVLGRAGRIGPVFAPVRDTCLHELLAAGYRGDDAVRRLRTVVFHVVGFVMVERGLAAYRPAAPPGTATDLAGLAPPDELAAAMGRFDADALFDFSLRTVLDGVFA